MSTPVITLTSPSKTGISYHQEITKNTRDPSFSSYLDGSEETFVLKLGGGATTHRLTSTTAAATAATNDQNFAGKKKSDDIEIDVFDAEKYFNEGLINHTPKVVTKNSSTKKDEPLEKFAVKEKTTKSISIRSESSSNSRSALLQNIPKKHHPKKAAANKKSFLATIGCNCSCAGKNSVIIDEHRGENVKSRTQADHRTRDHLIRKSVTEYTCVRFDQPELKVNSEGHFSFPVFNQDNEKKKKINSNNNCLSLEEKLTMMTWDTIAATDQETKINPQNSSENDSDQSDTSSDLFEIESLSKGNSSYLSRQASDSMSCVTPRTCYAPSEASIEWSVVTASAADFSVISDTDELKYSKKTKEVTKIRPSILSGCKSDKAVNVVGDAHNRTNEQGISSSRRHLTGESFTRFRDEIKVAGFDARTRRQSFDARVLLPQPRTGSSTTAHLLYT